MSERIPMTPTGYEKLKAEVEEMEKERPALTERIAEARAEGDLKENAEYHGARESLAMLDARISEKKGRLARAMIVDMSKIPRDEVGFSCTVTVLDMEFEDEEEFTLVGSGEEDLDSGRILASSPLALGLLGKKVGDVAEIDVPQGRVRFKILGISYPD